MDKFVIQGGVQLSGEVTPAGNKNAALPLLAASTLTDEPIILHNIPEIRDVHSMRSLLKSLGVTVESIGNHTWRLQAQRVLPSALDPDLCRSIRASILLAGPMIARSGELQLPPPGGDVIGRRRVDTHILALNALGAKANYSRSDRELSQLTNRLSSNPAYLKCLCSPWLGMNARSYPTLRRQGDRYSCFGHELLRN